MIYDVRGDGEFRGRVEWDGNLGFGVVDSMTGQEFYAALMYLSIEQCRRWPFPHPITALTKEHFLWDTRSSMKGVDLLTDLLYRSGLRGDPSPRFHGTSLRMDPRGVNDD